MSLPEAWYSVKGTQEPLDQGDLICGCPVLAWSNPPKFEDSLNSFSAASVVQKVDAVVLTQTCDLEQQRVRNVVLCPARVLSSVREGWNQARVQAGKQPTENAWNSFCTNVQKGKVVNLYLLQRHEGIPASDFRVLDFYDVFTAPLEVLNVLVSQGDRLALTSPQREAVNQRFSVCFSRIGLPEYKDLPWKS